MRRLGLFFALGLCLTGLTPAVARGAAPSLATNKDVIRKLYALYNAGDFSSLDSVLAADVIDHNPGPGQAPGLAGVKQTLMSIHTAYHGTAVMTNLIAEGDLVADRVVIDGTQGGPLFGIPATGKPIHAVANEIWRIKDGKAVEVWHVENELQVLVQIGVVPSPSGETGTPAAATPAAMMATPLASPMVATPASGAEVAANKALLSRYYAAVNAGNLAAFATLIAPNAVDHDPALTTLPPGREGIRQEIAGLRLAFPDYHVTNVQMIGEGDMVVVRSTAHGTQRGPLAAIPPTNKPVTFEAIDIWRIENGQIVDVWHVEQLLDVLIQIGALQLPGQAPATPMATSTM